MPSSLHPSALTGPFLVLLSAIASTALAQWNDPPTWNTPEMIDSGNCIVSPGAGRSATFWATDQKWHYVYEKDGDIYHAARNSEHWEAPERLTDDPAASRRPYIGRSEDALHLIWEDERSGHREVWTRRHDGSDWSAPECLTCDATESHSATLAQTPSRGNYDDPHWVFLVWTEDDGVTPQVKGRSYETGWTDPITLSSSSVGADQPAADISNWEWNLSVVWRDARHGEEEIYIRRRTHSGWEDEERITDLPGRCSNPSVFVAYCCSDIVDDVSTVLFENDETGVSEIWGACHSVHDPVDIEPVSNFDGIPSIQPAVDGAWIDISCCNCFGGPEPRTFATWTDEHPGAIEHRVRTWTACSYNWGAPFALTSSATGRSTISANHGEPSSSALATWTETAPVPGGGGANALFGQHATYLGCSRDTIAAPAVFLVSPEGYDNHFDIYDVCTGIPTIDDNPVRLYFHEETEAALTWDPFQERPPLSAHTEDGEVVYNIRGGGCTEVGWAAAGCALGPEYAVIFGVRSPDIDGNCRVDEADVAYIDAWMGTDAFCGDLDGSGLVDAADRQMVVERLGERCETTTNVDDSNMPTSVVGVRSLTVMPNPTTGTAEVQFRSQVPGRFELYLYDVQGRLLTTRSDQQMSPGINTVSWNLREGHEHRLARGVYVLELRTEPKSGTGRRSQVMLTLR